jgi:N-acetylglutamate synthase-like GNAT family acetyltransferase
MKARLFRIEDKEAVKTLLSKGGDTDLDSEMDRLVVVEMDGKVVGVVAARAIVYVHEFAVAPQVELYRRKVADTMLAYISGFCRATGEKEAVFIVSPENQKMLNWLSDKATAEDPGRLFTIRIE